MDRLGADHPTVKPVDLMAWLIRLVTPPGGRVLDPFAGSGSTGVAALGQGFEAVLIEREAKYVATIRRRLAWARGEGALTDIEMAGLDTPGKRLKAAGWDLPLFTDEDTPSQPASQPASQRQGTTDLRRVRGRRRSAP
ncbi:MAG: DNA methyltransferase [Caulobacter sp.]|nr:DNA methyltransferase [Caulobacter sp.]